MFLLFIRYDSFRGSAPSCILYRITIPGEAFASKFTCQPEQHYFPPAAVGSMALVNVTVRSYPRTDKIPKVLCTHNIAELRSDSPTTLPLAPAGDVLQSDSSSTASPVCTDNSSSLDQSSDIKRISPTTTLEENKLPLAGALTWKETERIETDLRKMALVKNKLTECSLSNTNAINTTLPRSDSMDSMLGDSLLDPPQDLQKIPPKRYQSPSRCGSPSIEAPEHLLFRSHYSSIDNTSGLSQAYKVNGVDSKHAESAKNRLARQDLLRRRDIGQTFGTVGSCHGLHPRMLLNVGQHQPRLSLPPKQTSTIVNPIITNGPYRAFPPERGMHQFSFMDRSSCSQIDSSQNFDVENVGTLSQNFEKMQIKCNISGKHICNQTQHDYNNIYQECDKTPCDTNIQELHGNAIDINSEKEPVMPYSNISRPQEELKPSFVLGGAKKKSGIPATRVQKKKEYNRTLSSKRRHDRNIESDDDTGMEVAEYDIKDINSSIFNESAKKSIIGTEKFDERQVSFQKEVNDILDGLAPKKEICTSRRSSLKDEDQLFPHKCNCSKSSSRIQIDPLNQSNAKSFEYQNSSLTQVYRSDVQIPLMPSPLLQLRSKKNETDSSSMDRSLNKADILLGAIMRTCERNRHLESENDHTTESSISSREDSYSVGAVRKSPEERKNSAGDADNEEGNTSSDNGSSILSSASSSDDEETQFQHNRRSDLGWYKNRCKRVLRRANQKKKSNVEEKKSDSSASQCSPCNLKPSTNTSYSLSQNDESPLKAYVKTQNICDKEEEPPNIESIAAIESKKGNRLNNRLCTDEHSMAKDLNNQVFENKATEFNVIKSSNKISDQQNQSSNEVMLNVSNNDAYVMNIENTKEQFIYRENPIYSALNEYDESGLENEVKAPIEIEQKVYTKSRTRSENLHEYSSLTHHDSKIYADMQNEKVAKIYRLESQGTDSWLDENCSYDYELDSSYMRKNNNILDDINPKDSRLCSAESFSSDKTYTALNDSSNVDESSKNPAGINNGISIPTMVQKDNFRKNLNSATSMVFHRNTGLPLSSSPAPLRRGAHDFGYDSSINTPNAIKR